VTQTVDVNILLYASNADGEEHSRGVALLEHLTRGPGLLVLLWPVLMGYLRIATSPAIFTNPMRHEEAAGNVASLLSLPHVRAVGETDGFWDVYRAIADPRRPRGKQVPDAHIAALMLHHGIARIWTRDRDFQRFEGIVVSDPFSSRYDAGFNRPAERRRHR
jgi:toxin-antitoxin system PIN domain toxin